MYIDNGYLCKRMLKMNVLTILPKIIMNKNSNSVYMLELSCLWYSRLVHINFKSLLKLMNQSLILTLKIDPNHKCKIWVEAKLSKILFHSVQRNTTPLELIHSDIYDLKFVQTKGGKKYFITFINNCTKYCYVFLLWSKRWDLRCIPTL